MARHDFSKNREALNKEMAHFVDTLKEMLPRYAQLLKQSDITPKESAEIVEMEAFLTEINEKISLIKQMLEHDMVGHSLDYYYQLKRLAAQGDPEAKSKLDSMREVFSESLKGNTMVNWN